MVSEIFGYDHLHVLFGPMAAYYITEGACGREYCLPHLKAAKKCLKKKKGRRRGAVTFKGMSSDLNSFP